MGKRDSIYFKDDEIIKKLHEEENKSDLIENLLRNYFNNSKEGLEKKRADLLTELSLIEVKLKKIYEGAKKHTETHLTKSQERERQKMLSEMRECLLQIWREERITEEEYFSCFTEGTLDLEIANKVITETKNLNKLEDIKKDGEGEKSVQGTP